MPTNYSPFGFDVDQGTTLPTIQAYINNYASPEAAAADTMEKAPRGYDYLVSQYQALTGDSFADPFEDAASARSRSLTDLAVSSQLGGPGTGTSFNVGNALTGPTINRPASQVVANRNVLDQVLNNQDRIAPLQSAIAAATLSHPELQLPEVGGSYTDLAGQTSSFTDIQKRRAAALGATDLFEKLTQNNPDALNPVDTTNPILQVDEKGNPIAGDVLNAKLFNDPEFQRALKFQPQKAAALYKALFDRDLKQDIGAQVGANEERTKTDDKILDAVDRGLDWDDITGEPYIRVMKSDPTNPGQEIETRRSLSGPERIALSKKGGFEARYGVAPPQGMKVSPDEANALRKKRDEIVANNPSIPKAIALLQARKELAASSKLGSRGGGGKLTQAADFFDKLSGAAINTGLDQTNRLFQGAGITEGPLFPMMKGGVGTQIGEAASSVADVGGSIFDWLKEETGPQGSFPIQ